MMITNVSYKDTDCLVLATHKQDRTYWVELYVGGNFPKSAEFITLDGDEEKKGYDKEKELETKIKEWIKVIEK